MVEVITGITGESFQLLARMAPYLLLGIVVAGALHIFLPEGLVARLLGGPGFKPTFRAALLGVPLPLCSCSVVPVAASLKRSGATKSATVSFLITTPTSGVDSILATYSLLGMVFTVARVVSSFLIGLVVGTATRFVTRNEPGDPKDLSPRIRVDDRDHTRHPIVKGLVYGFSELLGSMAKSLALGTLLGGAVAYFIPEGLLEQTIGTGLLSYLVMMIVGIPLYVCASGSIPLAAALLVKGLSPGAALVFLIAGPATNIATLTVVSRMLGKKVLLLFLTLLGIGSLLSGALLDVLLAGFPTLIPNVTPHTMHDGLGIFETISALVLALGILYHIAKPYLKKFDRHKGDDAMFSVNVPDMTCQHCAGTITKAATSVPGVKRVDADPDTKLVAIDAEESCDRAAVLDAIREAGFHPKAAE